MMPKNNLSDDEIAQVRRLLNAMDADDNGSITFGVLDGAEADDTEAEEEDTEEETEDESDEEETDDAEDAKPAKKPKKAEKEEESEDEEETEEEESDDDEEESEDEESEDDEDEEEEESEDEEDPRDVVRELMKKLIDAKDKPAAVAVLKKFGAKTLTDVPDNKLEKLTIAVKAALKA